MAYVVHVQSTLFAVKYCKLHFDPDVVCGWQCSTNLYIWYLKIHDIDRKFCVGQLNFRNKNQIVKFGHHVFSIFTPFVKQFNILCVKQNSCVFEYYIFIYFPWFCIFACTHRSIGNWRNDYWVRIAVFPLIRIISDSNDVLDCKMLQNFGTFAKTLIHVITRKEHFTICSPLKSQQLWRIYFCR